ncbi:hypothetical protein EH244_12205 [Variovorax beijingensis]|jgi:hypothetical protein|uniref:Uncharacterized protein n=2 Tax=Variovorax beijingensis TaxID=2496117 RepID=A0A3P3EQU2_9BURK|nr:hypothetical protein [Variovorax beijingensis]RRH88396.1 hypothetical protein EH244_12205 [Variovorax beijingensis]RSZ38625.1 hypothetical protein EJO66_09555 [Variovorax beijingensis]
MPGDSTRAPRPYEAFVYGNSADEPTRLAERCLEVIEGTLKSVDRVVACLRAAELEHGIGIPAMTRAQIADAAEWHRAKLQGLLAVKLQLTNRGGDIHLVDDLHLVVRLKSRLTARARGACAPRPSFRCSPHVPPK